jgi:SAM-dependent methyltransferase
MEQMSIDYSHALNLHSQEGPSAAFTALFGKKPPGSLLDIGCGTGTWLRAALDAGVTDLQGVDGIELPDAEFLVPKKYFVMGDLTKRLHLSRRFDLAISLEVAEHLEPAYADVIVESLTSHADNVLFSAACPGQPGQHHVNCQWPAYWQSLFNSKGYVCDDSPRWLIWNDQMIEPWYCQNLIRATRDADRAGKEPRICAVIHPRLLDGFCSSRLGEEFGFVVKQIETGRMPCPWYLRAPVTGLMHKLWRFVGGRRVIRDK